MSVHETATGSAKPAGWLPDGALPCVWMSAGLLTFKLCERGLDCEHCPLDAALTGGPHAEEPSAADHREHLRFPDDRRYGASHAWVQRLSPGRVRVGLDMFAGRLLGRANGVVLPPVGARLARGRPACWVEAADELIPLCAPLSGTVTARNAEVQDRPSLLASAPYDEGWLLELRGDAEDARLHPAARARRDTAGHLRRLHAEVRRATAAEPAVGATLRDGGRPVGDLRAILGPKRWRRTVDAVLR